MSNLTQVKYDILNELLEEYLKCNNASRLSKIRDMIDRLDYSLDLDENYSSWCKYIK